MLIVTILLIKILEIEIKFYLSYIGLKFYIFYSNKKKKNKKLSLKLKLYSKT